MNIVDAIRRMVRAYPGGVEALAPRIDKSPSTLDKEVRRAPGFKLGADDALEISTMCYELGMAEACGFINAWAAEMGCMVVPLPPVLGLDGAECMQALATTSREAADLIAEGCAALADGKVSDNELVRIDRATGEMVAAAQALRRAMAALNAAGKPQAD